MSDDRRRGSRGPMKTVLVVDDSRTIRTAARWALRSPDLRVVERSSGADVAAAIEEERPDLVLLDVGLEDADGFEVCAALRRGRFPADLPVILMAPQLERFDPARADAVGASGHVMKPFSTTDLLRAVRAPLGLSVPETTPMTYAHRLAARRAAESASHPPPVPVEAAPPPPAPASEFEIEEAEPVEIPVEVEPAPTATSAGSTHRPRAASTPPAAHSVPPAAASAVAGRVAEAGADAIAAQVEVPGLDREELRALAREVLEAVAWEVVPDLAETIIREELERLTRA